MKVLFISMVTGNKFAGPSYSVPATVKEISRLCSVAWYNLDSKYYFNQSDFPDVMFYCKVQIPDYTSHVLLEVLKDTDVVVFEDLYNIEFCKIAAILRKKKIPYIIVPRGGLCKAAQKKKRLKKFVANIVIFNKYIKEASLIHYLTDSEYKDSGDKWNENHVIIPNGVDIPANYSKVGENDETKGVFIGRIDIYHKGIDLLLEAIKENKNDLVNRGYSIDLYGADLTGDSEKINSIIDEYEIGNIVKVRGPVYDEEKKKVLLNSDFFILTSRFEGHPTGLLEALSYGLPSLVTFGSNMGEEIESNEAGFVSETNAESISESIKKMINEKSNMVQYGKNARELAKKYSWESVCKTIFSVLEKIASTRGR